MSYNCMLAFWMSEGVPTNLAVLRWDEADGSPCPATTEEFSKGVRYTFGIVITWVGDPRCSHSWADYRSGSFDDYGLEPGRTYRYRVWTDLFKDCHYITCVSDSFSPPQETSVKTLTFGPTNTRPALLEVLGLKATLGATTCNQWIPDFCVTDITYTWNPAAGAASYMLIMDNRAPDENVFDAGWTFPVAASPAPSYKAQGRAGGQQNACLGIVTDPTNPPNPRKGECILLSLPWP